MVGSKRADYEHTLPIGSHVCLLEIRMWYTIHMIASIAENNDERQSMVAHSMQTPSTSLRRQPDNSVSRRMALKRT